MEMNTRLQVEHPVTEEITGVDLVEWQLRVASGEPLPVAQEDLTIKGHAVEVRLYAEDPANGFLPATGPLEHLVFPEGARVDTGVRPGDEITPHYDPMIAKLTVHGADRDAAFAALNRALSRTEIAGTTTNLGFLNRLASNEDVRRGQVDTGLIARQLDQLTAVPHPLEDAWGVAVAKLLSPPEGTGFSLWAPLTRHVRLGGHVFRVSIANDIFTILADGWQRQVTKDRNAWVVDGRRTDLHSVRVAGAVAVFGPGGGTFPVDDPLNRTFASESDGDIRAPMPGLVTKLSVSKGDFVEKGQILATLEAMKMEHTLTAPMSGRIGDVLTSEAAQVAAGTTLLRIECEREVE